VPHRAVLWRHGDVTPGLRIRLSKDHSFEGDLCCVLMNCSFAAFLHGQRKRERLIQISLLFAGLTHHGLLFRRVGAPKLRERLILRK